MVLFLIILNMIKLNYTTNNFVISMSTYLSNDRLMIHLSHLKFMDNHYN
jgi:hypothetical protein